ncbi:arylsulfatase regulator [Sphingomonas panacis]|uniref:Arylsulfatase regulator n=1 Tax=Sphingomonas panacis TaxID=1560345 RepID=A0A1B3ZA79_9SPHN|nr:arylsulfatase regulator [Sphingomonas panacis]
MITTRQTGEFYSGTASDIDLLGGMFDLMPGFKALLDSPYRGEIEENATRFPGLYRYGVMLSNVAEGIADGSIRVPR